MLIYAEKDDQTPLVVEGKGKLSTVLRELEENLGNCIEIKDPSLRQFPGSSVIKRSIECEGNQYFIYAQTIRSEDFRLKDTELSHHVPNSLSRIHVYNQNSEGSEVLEGLHAKINKMGEEYLESLKPSKVVQAVEKAKEIAKTEINVSKGLEYAFAGSLNALKRTFL